MHGKAGDSITQPAYTLQQLAAHAHGRLGLVDQCQCATTVHQSRMKFKMPAGMQAFKLCYDLAHLWLCERPDVDGGLGAREGVGCS